MVRTMYLESVSQGSGPGRGNAIWYVAVLRHAPDSGCEATGWAGHGVKWLLPHIQSDGCPAR